MSEQVGSDARQTVVQFDVLPESRHRQFRAGDGDRKQQRLEFQGLSGMRGNTKSLKKNTGELEGILIGP